VKEKTPVEHLYFIYRGMASAFRSLTQQLPQQQALVAVKDEEVTIKNGVMDNTDPVNVDNFFFDKVAKKKKNTFDKSKEEKEVEVQLGQLGSEDIFGEAAIFEPLNGFFPASIRADTICEIIRIEKHLFAKQKGIIFLRMGPVDVDFLKKLKHFCFRCPSDKLVSVYHCNSMMLLF
jgi:CRP-like cAMP-binding protein